jgi:hypothetical protein
MVDDAVSDASWQQPNSEPPIHAAMISGILVEYTCEKTGKIPGSELRKRGAFRGCR